MEYHKIETLYERDELTHKLKPELILKNPTYGLLKTWLFTEKVDGTNIRCIWNCATGRLTFNGKTDNAQVPGDLIRWLHDNVSEETMRSLFPETNVVIYGEGYGKGIQKGGPNYSPIKKLIVFDVLVDGKWWLNWEGVTDVASKLGLQTVPLYGEMTLEKATAIVKEGLYSRCAETPDTLAEGLVGRPAETLFDKKGARVILKLKTKDF